MQTVERAPDSGAPPRLRWYKEFVIMAVFYAAYSLARNHFGSSQVVKGEPPLRAYNNALHLIRVERRLHIFVERHIQHAFLGWTWFIKFWNVYYGTFHFVVTIGAFIWLFLKAPQRFARWRNVLGITTALAIVGFSLFPLMPPRLLDQGPPFGGREWVVQNEHHEVVKVGPDVNGVDRPRFGFVDTLDVYGGFWSFDNGTMKEISNQYAAMPSLHTAWAVWCVLVLWPIVRHRSLRFLLALYPVATVFCIVVTANHYWLDGVAGLLCLAIGTWAGTALHDWNQRRLRRNEEIVTDGATAA